jgi:hypothetical protein
VRSPLKRAAERGAALAETALVVGVILIMILGSVQLGVVGYLQMTADAAAFLSAHQMAVGDPNAIAATTSVFPQFNALQISSTPAPAPAPTVYIDYGYNDPNPTIAAASGNNRHGGASMMEPSQLTTKVQKSNVISLLGVPLSVEGSMIEPQWLENGAHFDVANSPNYGQAGTNFQEDYFQNGENTPPYFVGYNYIENCPDPQPWGATQTACAEGVQFRALGVAEHLDDSIWELPDGELPGLGNPGAQLAFAQVACHQRVYATLAAFFSSNSTLGVLQNPINSGKPISGPMGSGDYKFWAPFVSGLGQTGFQVSPTVSGTVTGFAADSAIQQIYGWDVMVTAGVSHSTGVGSNPFPASYGAGMQSVGTPYAPATSC